MRFDYFQYRGPTGQLIRIPYLLVTLSYQEKAQPIWALVDSGADACLFHSSVGRLLGIDITTGRLEIFQGIGGGDIVASFHTLTLTIEALNSIELEVGFTDSQSINPGVLGQRGFFDQYQIRFERYKNSFEIYPRSTSV